MTKELWSGEYLRKGIPSSYRQEATRAVVEFVPFLAHRGCVSGKALDLGCGKGRNAFFLAERNFDVIALDWVAENADEINREAKARQLPLKAFCQSVVDPWPVEDQSVDIAIDIFCYKHIVDKTLQARYRRTLFRALKDKGYYLISLAADNDGFYGPLLQASPDPSRKLIVDPVSKIGSFLYSIEDIVAEFSDNFNAVWSENYLSVSPMYGKQYPRSVLNIIFQKKY